MKKILTVLLLLTAVTAFAQQQSTPNPVTGTNRTPMEQKGYDDAMREVEQQKQKAEADKKKAVEDAHAKQLASFVTSSVADVAGQELLADSKKKEVKEAKKLMEENQKLEARLLANYKRLEELNRHPASVVKIAPDGK